MAGNKNTDAIRRYAARIRDSDDDDEITAEHLIDAMKAGAVIATGKHRPMTKDEANEVTPTDPGRKVESGPPSTVTKLKLLDPARIKSVPQAIAFVALVAAIVALAIWGPGWAQWIIAP